MGKLGEKNKEENRGEKMKWRNLISVLKQSRSTVTKIEREARAADRSIDRLSIGKSIDLVDGEGVGPETDQHIDRFPAPAEILQQGREAETGECEFALLAFTSQPALALGLAPLQG